VFADRLRRTRMPPRPVQNARHLRFAVLYRMLSLVTALAVVGVTRLGGSQDVASTSASRYVITNLGTLRSGTSSGAETVNNRGEAVGSADTAPCVARLATSVKHAFLWKSGAMRDLGALVRGEPSGAT